MGILTTPQDTLGLKELPLTTKLRAIRMTNKYMKIGLAAGAIYLLYKMTK